MAAVTTKRETTFEPVSPERIAMRAYELFLLRGGADGNDVQDWLTAEQELLAAANPAPKRRVVKAAAAMKTEETGATKKVARKLTDTKTTKSATRATRSQSKTTSAKDKTTKSKTTKDKTK